jgi:hypothetical protein
MRNTLERILSEKGLSLYRLGKLTSIPYSSLHAFKSSQAKLAACSATTLFTMAKALGVPMERFFEDGKLHLPRRFAPCFWDIDMTLTKENTASPSLGFMNGAESMASAMLRRILRKKKSSKRL